jgi:hypothetical protein
MAGQLPRRQLAQLFRQFAGVLCRPSKDEAGRNAIAVGQQLQEYGRNCVHGVH